tara:strand:+ start:216 stop:974 length:759 start_codon:yes stop_codon:yes gene_type:complete
MPSKHALLSPSAAERWTKCPASPSMSQGSPYRTSYPAERGTLIHEMAEKVLKDQIKDSSLEDHYAGKTFTTVIEEDDEKIEVVVDEEMLGMAKQYAAYILQRHEELGGKRLIEEQVTLEEINPHLWGTLDCAIITEKEIEIIDLKTGAWPVDPNNLQLKIYALGILDRYPYENAKVKLTIVQPVSRDKKGPIKTYETTVEDLVNWAYDFLKPAADACLEPEPKFNFGEHCRFCLYQQQCPTYNTNKGGVNVG